MLLILNRFLGIIASGLGVAIGVRLIAFYVF